MRREIESFQRKMRMISLIKSGLGTPALSGPDSNQATITDNGVGDYTITFAESFANTPVVMMSAATADRIPVIHTLANSSVRINTRNLGTSEISPSGLLSLVTTAVTIASRTAGTLRNGDTVTVAVAAAAANPTDTILLVASGNINAVTLTVTPNDGTNNAATPVDLTTAELVEFLSTGAVAGKNVTLTDAGFLIPDLTASGGGAEALADGGEGDGGVATLAGGAAEVASALAEGDFHVMILGSDVEDKY